VVDPGEFDRWLQAFSPADRSVSRARPRTPR